MTMYTIETNFHDSVVSIPTMKTSLDWDGKPSYNHTLPVNSLLNAVSSRDVREYLILLQCNLSYNDTCSIFLVEKTILYASQLYYPKFRTG